MSAKAPSAKKSVLTRKDAAVVAAGPTEGIAPSVPGAGGAEPPAVMLSALALLQLVADPKDFAAAIPMVRARLKLTPEKIAVLLMRIVNPDEVLEEREEQRLRGCSDKTLKAMKDNRELPHVLQGEIIQGAVPRPV